MIFRTLLWKSSEKPVKSEKGTCCPRASESEIQSRHPFKQKRVTERERPIVFSDPRTDSDGFFSRYLPARSSNLTKSDNLAASLAVFAAGYSSRGSTPLKRSCIFKKRSFFCKNAGRSFPKVHSCCLNCSSIFIARLPWNFGSWQTSDPGKKNIFSGRLGQHKAPAEITVRPVPFNAGIADPVARRPEGRVVEKTNRRCR